MNPEIWTQFECMRMPCQSCWIPCSNVAETVAWSAASNGLAGPAHSAVPSINGTSKPLGTQSFHTGFWGYYWVVALVRKHGLAFGDGSHHLVTWIVILWYQPKLSIRQYPKSGRIASLRTAVKSDPQKTTILVSLFLKWCHAPKVNARPPTRSSSWAVCHATNCNPHLMPYFFRATTSQLKRFFLVMNFLLLVPPQFEPASKPICQRPVQPPPLWGISVSTA
jgi:hypothetical protein